MFNQAISWIACVLSRKTYPIVLVLSLLLIGRPEQVFSLQSEPTMSVVPTLSMDILAEGGIRLLNPNVTLWIQQQNHLDFAFCTDFEANDSSSLYLFVRGSNEGGNVEGKTNDMQLVLQGLANSTTCSTLEQAILQEICPNQHNMSQNGRIEFLSIFKVELTEFVDEAVTYFSRINNISPSNSRLMLVHGFLGFKGALDGGVQEAYSFRSLYLLVRLSGNVLSFGVTVVVPPDCILREFIFNELEVSNPSLKTISAKEEIEQQQLWVGHCNVLWEVHDWTVDIPWRYIIPLVLTIIASVILERMGILPKIWKKRISRPGIQRKMSDYK